MAGLVIAGTKIVGSQVAGVDIASVQAQYLGHPADSGRLCTAE